MDLGCVISELSNKRPVFHSEADFQHALAWTIHSLYPDIKVRLEYPASGLDAHIDILVRSGKEEWPIEVKYKTKKLDVQIDGEKFFLKSQGAADQARYAFFKDIKRLEAETTSRTRTVGYAVMLTNDALLWRPANKPDVFDLNFHIHEGRTASGKLKWDEQASKGTMSVGAEPIELANTYLLSWADYSRPVECKNGLFRLLIVRVLSVNSVRASTHPTLV